MTKASVAIDGSKSKAVEQSRQQLHEGKIQRRQQIEESVARYIKLSWTPPPPTAAGRAAETVLLTKTRLTEKLAKLEEEVKRLAAIQKAPPAAPDKQISLTDPHCRSMATSGRGSGTVAVQRTKCGRYHDHLIVAHEVTNVGADSINWRRWRRRRNRAAQP